MPMTEQWSTGHLAPLAQFGAWREMTIDAHLAWDIPSIDCERFPAYMHQHRIDALRVTDCTASVRVSGTRSERQMAQDGGAYLNVVLIAEGEEQLRFGPREADVITLQAGMARWSSSALRPARTSTARLCSPFSRRTDLRRARTETLRPGERRPTARPGPGG